MPPCNFDVVMRLTAICSETCHLKDIGVASNWRHLQMRGRKCEMGKGKKERKKGGESSRKDRNDSSFEFHWPHCTVAYSNCRSLRHLTLTAILERFPLQHETNKRYSTHSEDTTRQRIDADKGFELITPTHSIPLNSSYVERYTATDRPSASWSNFCTSRSSL